MITVGVDAHKRSHTMVAIGETGARLSGKTVPVRAVVDTARESVQAARPARARRRSAQPMPSRHC